MYDFGLAYSLNAFRRHATIAAYEDAIRGACISYPQIALAASRGMEKASLSA
jgi:hypothetical protein